MKIFSKYNSFIIILLFIIIILISCTFNQKNYKVTIDPRIELISIIRLLNDSKLVNDYDSNYKEEIERYFNPYQNHKVVKLQSKMEESGFDFGVPIETVLYLSTDLKEKSEIPDSLIERAGGEDILNNYISFLGEFNKETKFNKYYNENNKFYNSLVREFKNNIDISGIINAVEDYYGINNYKYNIILSPLIIGGYGPRIKSNDNQYDIYSIIGPREYNSRKYVFVEKYETTFMLWHEFSHSFVNPLTKEHKAQVKEYSQLYKSVASKMEDHSYNTWEKTLNEHIVRAVVIRLVYDKFGKNVGERYKTYQEEQGFIYLNEICDILIKYEKNRDIYPNFNSFYPLILKELEVIKSKLNY